MKDDKSGRDYPSEIAYLKLSANLRAKETDHKGYPRIIIKRKNGEFG